MNYNVYIKLNIILQLENGHTLFDYSVGLNEIIQLLIRPPTLTEITHEIRDKDKQKSDKSPVSFIYSYDEIFENN